MPTDADILLRQNADKAAVMLAIGGWFLALTPPAWGRWANNPGIALLTGAAFPLLGLFAGWALVAKEHSWHWVLELKPDLDWKRVRRSAAPLVPLLPIGVWLCNVVTILLMKRWLGVPPAQQAVLLLRQEQHLLPVAISSVLLAPIHEELFYRLALPRLLTERGTPPGRAAILCSLLFATMHFLWWATPGLALLSLALFHCRQRWDIRVSILIHATFNAITFLCAIATSA